MLATDLATAPASPKFYRRTELSQRVRSSEEAGIIGLRSLVDAIISSCVINLAADKDKFLAEACRVLRPDG